MTLKTYVCSKYSMSVITQQANPQTPVYAAHCSKLHCQTTFISSSLSPLEQFLLFLDCDLNRGKNREWVNKGTIYSLPPL